MSSQNRNITGKPSPMNRREMIIMGAGALIAASTQELDSIAHNIQISATNGSTNGWTNPTNPNQPTNGSAYKSHDDRIDLIMPTFLGRDDRRFYGRGTPTRLNFRRKFRLGCGTTAIGKLVTTWCGTGWTGQPTLVSDNGRERLVIGSYDHMLRCYDLENATPLWEYQFDDVIKGTATIYVDKSAQPEDRIVILQGSRAGSTLSTTRGESLRAISLRTGKELWRHAARRTRSYSRDNDSSPLVIDDVIFNANENAIGSFFDAKTSTAIQDGKFRRPRTIAEVQLYEDKDAIAHGGNLVAEASPTRIGGMIFIPCGSGHVYGIDIATHERVWDYPTRSDLDGTAPASSDGMLFCPVEKQYIPGKGGVIKLDPRKRNHDAVQWFLPTQDMKVADWDGGVIGSVALNDEYALPEHPRLFATSAIDGTLYLGSQHEFGETTVDSPNLDALYRTPKVVQKARIGPSISTPIFCDGDTLVAGSYNGVRLFKIHYDRARSDGPTTARNNRGEPMSVTLEERARFSAGGSFEATPIAHNGSIFIASRDGYLYELG